MSKNVNDIKVGYKVEVINKGKTYTTHQTWANSHLKAWQAYNKCQNGDVGIVVAVAPLTPGSEDILLGVDFHGKLVIIGVDGVEIVQKDFNLKQFQRVELRDGTNAIVIPSNDEGDLALVFGDERWCGAFFNTGDDYNKRYEIVKVYDIPFHRHVKMLDPKVRGALLWEATNPKQVAADEAVKEAENAVEAAKKALEAALQSATAAVEARKALK